MRAGPSTHADAGGPDPLDQAVGVVRSFRLTPDAARVVVDVTGVGELDGIGVPGWTVAPGERVVVEVDRRGLAVLGDL